MNELRRQPWQTWIKLADAYAISITEEESHARPTKRQATSRPSKGMRPCLVHHVWLQLPKLPVDAYGMSAVDLECLASWEPWDSWLWTCQPLSTDTLSWLQTNCPHLKVKNTATIMTACQIAGMVACNVPVQLVKDILSMAILHAHGGVFADLDIYWMGRHMSLTASGHWFPLEPPPRSGNFFCRKSDRVSLAILAMPANCKVAMTLHQKWMAAWSIFAASQVAPGAIQTDWQDKQVLCTLWMQNTRQLQHAIENAGLSQSCCHPIFGIPWTLSLNEKEFLAIDSGQCNDKQPHAMLNYKEKYQQPSLATVKKYACCVNLWGRQWKGGVRPWVIQRLRPLRAAATKLPSTLPPTPEVMQAEDSMQAARFGMLRAPEQHEPPMQEGQSEQDEPPEGLSEVHVHSPKGQAAPFDPAELERIFGILSPAMPCLGHAQVHTLLTLAHTYVSSKAFVKAWAAATDCHAMPCDWAGGIVLYCAHVGMVMAKQHWGSEDIRLVEDALGSHLAGARTAMQALSDAALQD